MRIKGANTFKVLTAVLGTEQTLNVSFCITITIIITGFEGEVQKSVELSH